MSIYKITRGQLSVILIAGLLADLIGWVDAIGYRSCTEGGRVFRDYCKPGYYVDNVLWLVFAIVLLSILVFYYIGWKNDFHK